MRAHSMEKRSRETLDAKVKWCYTKKAEEMEKRRAGEYGNAREERERERRTI